jgi:LEA14-like dessication related protein
MMMKSFKSISLISLAIMGTGCEAIKDNPYLSQFLPTVAFDGLQVNHVTFEEVDTEFLFAIDNPNPVGIDIEDFSYSLAFADVSWMDGDNPDGLLLGATGVSEVSLPTNIVFADLFDMVQAARGSDNLPFGLSGDFGLRLDSSTLVTENTADTNSNEDAEVVYLPYDAEGDFPALRKPKFSLNKLRVKNLSLSEITLDLVMDVDNEHASNLIFQRFAYDLSLGGTSTLSGIVDDLEEVVHGGDAAVDSPNQKVRLPITIDSLSVIGSLWDLLRNGQRLNAQFAATTDVDTPFGLMELAVDETGDLDVQVQ